MVHTSTAYDVALVETCLLSLLPHLSNYDVTACDSSGWNTFHWLTDWLPVHADCWLVPLLQRLLTLPGAPVALHDGFRIWRTSFSSTAMDIKGHLRRRRSNRMTMSRWRNNRAAGTFAIEPCTHEANWLLRSS